jgi:hypothetical protein
LQRSADAGFRREWLFKFPWIFKDLSETLQGPGIVETIANALVDGKGDVDHFADANGTIGQDFGCVFWLTPIVAKMGVVPNS